LFLRITETVARRADGEPERVDGPGEMERRAR
jgi:hypothetical protein